MSFSTSIKQINILIQYVGTRIASILFWESTFTARTTQTLVYEFKKKEKKKINRVRRIFMVSAMSSLKITTLTIDASYLV